MINSNFIEPDGSIGRQKPQGLYELELKQEKLQEKFDEILYKISTLLKEEESLKLQIYARQSLREEQEDLLVETKEELAKLEKDILDCNW